MKAAVAIITIVSVVLAGSIQPPEPPTPLDEYWQLLQETHALLTNLEHLPAEVGRAECLAMADRWARISEILLPDGTPVPVNHSYLVSRLRNPPSDPAQLDELLSTLLAARDSWPQSGRTAEDLTVLAGVLARPEFEWPSEEPSPLAEWFQNLWDEFMRLLPDDGDGGTAALLRYVLLGLGTAVLAAVLLYIARRLSTSLVAETAVDADEAGELNLTATEALDRAQSLSTGGDYRTAVRYLYLAALLRLEERGLLRYDRSLTNREYLRSVRHIPQLAAILGPVVDLFERVWYGFQPVDRKAYSEYTNWVTDLRRQR